MSRVPGLISEDGLRELDRQVESALAEAGDYLMAVQEGSIGPDHIQAEIGEVLVGARPGRAGVPAKPYSRRSIPGETPR